MVQSAFWASAFLSIVVVVVADGKAVDESSLDEYIDQYGDPRAQENKKRKHTVRKVAGIEVVVMPRARGTAMTLRQSHADRNLHDDVMEDGDSQSEVGDDQCEKKFEHMHNEFKDTVASMNNDSGWSFEKLLADAAENQGAENEAEDEDAASVEEPIGRKRKARLGRTVSDEVATPRPQGKTKSIVKSKPLGASSTASFESSGGSARGGPGSAHSNSKLSSRLDSQLPAQLSSQLKREDAKKDVVVKQEHVKQEITEADGQRNSNRGRKPVTPQSYIETQWPLWEQGDEDPVFFQ